MTTVAIAKAIAALEKIVQKATVYGEELPGIEELAESALADLKQWAETRPSREAMEAAVALEIQHTLGAVTTESIGALIDQVVAVRLISRSVGESVGSAEAGTAAPPADASAISDVIAERRRQIEVEGWSAEHDDAQHLGGELAEAAACYALAGPDEPLSIDMWPWDASWWKPKDRRRNLVRSAALIIAEIERLDRLSVTAPDASADRWTEDNPFQHRVADWMIACFGAEISGDKIERNHRFIEEALELVQACGCTKSEAHQLVDYVYDRPQGDVNQEVGGVMVTLAALCLANGFDMHVAGETELARVWQKIDKIRAKQAAKPKHSPLPEASAEQPQEGGDPHKLGQRERSPRSDNAMPASGPDAVTRAHEIVDQFIDKQATPNNWRHAVERIASAITQAVSAEREACAKIADKEAEYMSGGEQIERAEARHIASLIHARGKPDERENP